MIGSAANIFGTHLNNIDYIMAVSEALSRFFIMQMQNG